MKDYIKKNNLYKFKIYQIQIIIFILRYTRRIIILHNNIINILKYIQFQDKLKLYYLINLNIIKNT